MFERALKKEDLKEILLKDGVRYILYRYKNENELEKMVYEHYEDIFGEGVILFSKHSITTSSGIGSVPDAFVISIKGKKWYIVEVELSNHSLYNHIVPQLTKFYSAIKNPDTRSNLVKTFYKEIEQDPRKRLLFEIEGINEKYKFIQEIVEKKPTTVIIIDKSTEELNEICNALPFDIIIIVFKTFCRENTKGLCDHIHLLSHPTFKSKIKKQYSDRHDEILKFFNKDILPYEHSIIKRKDYMQISLSSGFYPLHYEWLYLKNEIRVGLHFEYPDHKRNEILATEFYEKFSKEIEKHAQTKLVVYGKKYKNLSVTRQIQEWTEEDAKWAAKTMEKFVTLTINWVLEKMKEYPVV